MTWQSGTERRFMQGRGVIDTGSVFTDPSDLTDGFAWYRADLGVSGAAPITAWADQIGSNNLTVGAGDPTLDTSEGFDFIYFDDVGGDNLSAASVSGSIITKHVFAVMRAPTPAVNETFIAVGDNHIMSYGGVSIKNYTSTVLVTGSPQPDANTWFLIEGLFLAGTDASSIILNDSAAVQGTMDTVIAPTLLAIGARIPGGSHAIEVDVAEVVICNAEITTDLTSLRAYFATRYGVATN